MALPRRKKRERTKQADPDRVDSKGHLQFVRGFECAIARKNYIWRDGGATGVSDHICVGKTEAAHVRTGTDGGIGIKPSDCYAIPLCSAAHREQHTIGETAFERRYGINMRKLADEIWQRSPHRAKWMARQKEMASDG